MSALDSMLHVGATATVRVPMRRPAVLRECIDRRAVDVADVISIIRLEPGAPLIIRTFLDRDRYTLCECLKSGLVLGVVLVSAADLEPLSTSISTSTPGS